MKTPRARFSSLAAALVTSVIVALAAASPAAAKGCSVAGEERKLGATYVTKVSVSQTGCSSALKVVKAYHSCRLKKGRKGTCSAKVRGFRCRERRSSVIPTQFTGTVTCKKGRAKIVHSYTQFT